MTIALSISVILLVVGFRFIVLKDISRLNPCWYFSLTNAVMGVGTLAILDWEQEADDAHGVIIVITALCYTVAATIGLRGGVRIREVTAQFWRRPLQGLSPRKLSHLQILMIISGLICVAYYVAIGYNLQILAIRNFLSGTNADYTTLRLNTYAGDRYFAPGYVNQFKNMVFPLGASVFVANRWLKNRHIGFSSWVLLAVSVIFLAGTGQRGAFVLWLVMSYLLYTAIRKPKWKSWFTPRRLAYILVALALFTGLSVVIGRLNPSDNIISGAVGAITHRVFVSNQSASATGFRVVYDFPIAYGREWLTAARGILPGNRGSELSSIIFEELFGGRRGTAPVSIWGSAWHNFGWVGVTVFPAMLGVAHAAAYRRMVGGDRTIDRLAFYSGATMLLSTWVAGSFMYLLNAGGIGLLIFRVAMKMRRPDAASTTSSRVRRKSPPKLSTRHAPLRPAHQRSPTSG